MAVLVDIMLGLGYDVMSCFSTLDISSGQPSNRCFPTGNQEILLDPIDASFFLVRCQTNHGSDPTQIGR